MWVHYKFRHKIWKNNLFIDIFVIEMWCWRRMEKISWNDHVRNEDLLLTLESRSITISCMKYVNGRRTGLVTFYVETAFTTGY
jgi:hypothetical protein